MRALTFESLVRDELFAGEVATTTVGRLGLDRPRRVIVANAMVSVDVTAKLLDDAHRRAVGEGAATLLYDLAVPFAGFEDERATDVKPDFAVVAPKAAGHGSWLVMGDAKDYERVRSRIDDHRLLKGFLQVALGAESAAAWRKRPGGLDVHSHGVLAVPRNAFLQPEALVELLDDHRVVVRVGVAAGRREPGANEQRPAPTGAYVRHLQATFDPAACTTCTLFSFCRQELRDSADPADLLTEIGIDPADRARLLGLVDGTGDAGDTEPASVNASVVAQVLATVDGTAQRTGQRRVDPVGLPGTVNVVVAKSDSAALGVYGLATQRVTAAGAGQWQATVFDNPQAAGTRRAVMRLLGLDLLAALDDQRAAYPAEPEPVHLVVPDADTGDLLASIADNLAGIELSRIRWENDLAKGRQALTFNGEPATIPGPLAPEERAAVSFLLEEDRARAFSLRSPVVDVRTAIGRHLVAGGPAISAARLDYLVAWTGEGPGGRARHRDIADRVEQQIHTPGARLTNRQSNAVHAAFTGTRQGGPRPADPAGYAGLILAELRYKSDTMDSALAALAALPPSRLRRVYRAVEGDAQAGWRRRLALHASDLVRFGRTYRRWRNSLVPAVEANDRCDRQLLALTNPQRARDAAADAGTRQLALALVAGVAPIVLQVGSRRIGDKERIVALHVGEIACVERPDVEVKFQKGSFRISGLSIGPLTVVDAAKRLFEWSPEVVPRVRVGDELVIADFSWFSGLKGNRHLPVDRPAPDAMQAPRPDCGQGSYAGEPQAHQYCCRPHEESEAEWSDLLAERRARGELNPQVWPPVLNADAFEVAPAGAPVGDPSARPAVPAPDDVTIDDVE
jgi:hypothetical protein